MKITARADIDVVALEQEDRVTVLLELTAPPAPADPEAAPRPAATVEVVLDRSGSMAGPPLEAAKAALARLVDRLDPADRLGIVAFDDTVEVVLPAGQLPDQAAKASARRAISAIGPGGSTNLSGGLLRGLQEARRAAGDAGATLILLSDGHANSGETDPARLSSVAASARERGVATATIGLGLGYDERLLADIARGGQGSHVFAEHGDAAAALLAAEVEGLLSTTVQAASLLIRPADPVQTVRIWNDLPSRGIDAGVMVELGDLWAGETRKLVIGLDVPAASALGLARVADLELRYVALPQLVEETVALPVHVNVVPGDQAAGRIPDPHVTGELVYQQAQDTKRRAADALERGDIAAAEDAYRTGRLQVQGFMASAPDGPLAEELAVEDAILGGLSDAACAGEVSHSAKLARSEHAHKSRRRGRRDPEER